MTSVIFIATGWGPKAGGINSFNYDLCLALSRLSREKNDIRVYCLSRGASDEEIAEAGKNGLTVINTCADLSGEDSAGNAISLLKSCCAGIFEGGGRVWAGHDIKTGFLAKACAAAAGGKAFLFHHMNYDAYYNYLTDSESALEKEQTQKRLFQGAGLIFAAGPLLKKSAEDIVCENEENVRVIEMIPGLADISPCKRTLNKISLISFGRIEKARDNDVIKQHKLALYAYAALISEGFLKAADSQMKMIGLEKGDGVSENELKKEAEARAGRKVNLKVLPYMERRSLLFSELKKNSASFMLSLHEGFGLTGLEAIAAEVPLILSQNSGLYKFLEKKNLACFIKKVEITGNGQKDLPPVVSALKEILENRKASKANAKRLLSKLKKICTWEKAAAVFYKQVKISVK